MRIGKRDIDGIQHHGMAHFAPVSGDHVRRHRQPRGATELCHHFATRETLLGATRIFCIGEHIVQPFAQRDRLIKQPGAVGINGNTRIRETLFQRASGIDLLLAWQHAAFEFEIFKTVAILRGFRQTHHGVTVQRFLMAQVIPVVIARRGLQIRQIGFRAIANVEEITEHGHRVTLLAWPQQFADRHVERLAQQIKQCGFQRGHRINAQFESPRAFAKGIKVSGLIAFVYLLNHIVHPGHFLTKHHRDGINQRLVDNLSARRFTDAGVAGVVSEDHDVAGKVRVMRAANIEEHTVMSGDRNDLHVRDYGAGLCRHDSCPATGFSSIRLISPTSTR